MMFDPNDPAFVAAVQTTVANILPMAVQNALVALGITPGSNPRGPAAPNSVRAQTRPPQADTITLAQFTLLDNGKKGVRQKYETEFKMCLELWTEPLATLALGAAVEAERQPHPGARLPPPCRQAPGRRQHRSGVSRPARGRLEEVRRLHDVDRADRGQGHDRRRGQEGHQLLPAR